MGNKGLVTVIIVMSLVILLLSALCAFLIIEHYTVEKSELQNYKEDNSTTQRLEDMEPWERYEKGYVFFMAENKLYHITQCVNMADGNWAIVTEEYAVVRGSHPCHVCMPGAN